MIRNRIPYYLLFVGALSGASPSGCASSDTVDVANTSASSLATSAAPEASSGNPGDANTAATNSSTGAGSKEAGELGGACSAAERIGFMQVHLTDGRTVFSGSVSDAVTPSSISAVLAEQAGCRLLAPRDLFCDPACSSEENCAGEGVCVAKAQKISAGTVTLGGFAEDVEITPNGITGDYNKTLLDPYPAFTVGAPLQIAASGDLVGPFAVNLWGVAPLVSDQAEVAVRRGQSAVLKWDADVEHADQTRIIVSFTVNAHGAVTSSIECTAPDTGTLQIPAELVTQLIDLGLSGFPRVSVWRASTRPVTLTQGCVDVSVGSNFLTLDLLVDGLNSCSEDADCAAPQTCSSELLCQ